MKFVKVTEHKNGKAYYVNANHICCLVRVEDKGYTMIEYTRSAAGEDYVGFVKETPEEILSQLDP